MTYDPFRGVGDATRRQILELLRGGERTVGELAANLPISRPAVSQHLAVLIESRMVTRRREGTRNFYRLDPEGFDRLRAEIDSLWGDAMAAYGEYAEREEETDNE